MHSYFPYVNGKAEEFCCAIRRMGGVTARQMEWAAAQAKVGLHIQLHENTDRVRVVHLTIPRGFVRYEELQLRFDEALSIGLHDRVMRAVIPSVLSTLEHDRPMRHIDHTLARLAQLLEHEYGSREGYYHFESSISRGKNDTPRNLWTLLLDEN
jgi:hypothetical protein